MAPFDPIFPPFPHRRRLISFGIDQAALYRLVASYVDRILKGEKPADLPVQAPTKYETVLTRLPKHSAWKYRRVCLPMPTS